MKVLKYSDRELCQELFEQMFRGRAAVFHDRLNWPVQVRDGLEIDFYDRELEPVYILDLDDHGHVRGSLRLLPTTGTTMIQREFLDFFDEPVDVVDPTMWECTKFCVHSCESATSTRLLIGLHDLCRQCGIERVIGQRILELIASGYEIKQIADTLDVSQTTIRNQLRYAVAKLGYTHHNQAVSKSILLGLIKPGNLNLNVVAFDGNNVFSV
ncbi:acyl-homoserine-lactone synthase [Phyllobacterium sp. 22229]|uniref:Acyl-homoserine-lactone synthase n=1 Tax=Agrobacterium radiobacter TaxID=362 RepID=A0ABD5LSZ2_AGRRD